MKYMVTYYGSYPFNHPNYGWSLLKEEFFTNKKEATKFFKKAKKDALDMSYGRNSGVEVSAVKIYKLTELK